MNKRWYWPVILVGLSLGVPGCKGSSNSQTAEMPVPKVTLTAVTQEQTVDFDEYTGLTQASETVEVRSRVYGFLKSIEFKDGDLVTAGQTLFQIEPDEYEAIHQQSLARIAMANARLDLNKANRARNQALLSSGAVSREEFETSVAAEDEAQAAIVSAKADANRSALDLKYTTIKAPIDGRIDRTLISKGNLITGGLGEGTMLTTIVNEQPMFVYFDVDERSLLKYQRMSSASKPRDDTHVSELDIDCFLQLADEKDFPHRGKLDFTANQVDKSTGTVKVRAVFANEDRFLKSGLFVRVRVPVSQPYEALIVPEQAIASDQDLKYVYVVGDDNLAQRRNIELGRQLDTRRLVTKGLQANERIIVKGLQRVRPGQKVEPQAE